jgi:hypothetical protein
VKAAIWRYRERRGDRTRAVSNKAADEHRHGRIGRAFNDRAPFSSTGSARVPGQRNAARMNVAQRIAAARLSLP